MNRVLTNIVHAREYLDCLWKRGCAFLGCRYAIMGGAMSWLSEHTLVAAISNAGGFGVLAGGSMGPDALAKEITATIAVTQQPFGVNLITLHPNLLSLIAVCSELRVSHVVLAGGLPTATAIRHIKDYGAKVICFASVLSLAQKLIRLGADALVIEGAEAGGHIGPVSTSVLAQEILPEIHTVPVFVAGGIGRGEAILSYLEMGASGCQLGTRFVCAYESIAHQNFKQVFLRAVARDAILSVQADPTFPVIPVRALTNKGTQAFVEVQTRVISQFRTGAITQKEAQLKIEHFWAGALQRAVIEGDVVYGSLMAGQSVGMVTREQSTAEIVNELVQQATNALVARQLRITDLLNN